MRNLAAHAAAARIVPVGFVCINLSKPNTDRQLVRYYRDLPNIQKDCQAVLVAKQV